MFKSTREALRNRIIITTLFVYIYFYQSRFSRNFNLPQGGTCKDSESSSDRKLSEVTGKWKDKVSAICYRGTICLADLWPRWTWLPLYSAELLSPGLEITGKQEQKGTPYSYRQKVTLEQTAAWCYNTLNNPGGSQQWPLPPFLNPIIVQWKLKAPIPQCWCIFAHLVLSLFGESKIKPLLSALSSLCKFFHSPGHQPP